MWSYVLTEQTGPILTLTEKPRPVPGAGEVVVDLKAASLNYRDVLVAEKEAGLIPLSDGAGVISALGAGVEHLAVGDRVVVGFMPGWIEGDFSATKKATALGGGGINGVLSEAIAVPATGVLKLPHDMTFEEAATLPCAGVTAWSALFERRPLQPGETVLLLGTGGVSTFALQLAKMTGARVIITSGSDEKLEIARSLGADDLINYRSDPDWAARVLHLTDGFGVDLSVDVAGPATLGSTLKATRHGGRISLMGVLSGFSGPVDTRMILDKRITLQGIYVGPVATMQSLLNTHVKPYIDQVFELDHAEDAYKSLKQARHVGKLVVRLSG